MKEVNMFDAKTHFSSIIAEVVENDEEFIVKKHGQQVARIIPYRGTEQPDVKVTINAMDDLAKEIGQQGISQEDIRKMREEGRS